MTCRELIDFIGAYLDAELPDDMVRVFERHLEVCPDCRDYLKMYRDTIELARAAACPDDDALPADVPDELVEAILAARRAGE